MGNTQKHIVIFAAGDPAQHLSLVAALEKHGYLVTALTDFRQVMAALSLQSADLILAGLAPPDLDGWRLCCHLRSPEQPAWNRIPILLVSAALADENARRVTTLLGGNGLLSLPCDEEQLLHRVRGLLGDPPGTYHRVPPLEPEESRFRRAVQNAGAGYFRVDTEGRFEWVNDAWLKMHGYAEAGEVVGRHFSLTQTEADLERAREIAGQVLAGEAIRAGEFTRKRRDGSIGYHTFSAHPVREGDRIVGMEGFLIDTTALHGLEERYQMLFTRMLDGFALHEMIFDAEGKPADYRFLAVNPAFEQMTGLRGKDIVGRTVLEVLPDTEAHWIESYGNVVLTGVPLRFENSHSGLNKHFDVHAFRPREGQFACIFRDISERKAHEDEIDTLWEEMRQTADDYRAIFEGALEGIFRTTPEGRILTANPAMAKMLGYDLDPTQISSHQVWANPEDRAPFLRRVEEHGSVRGYECRFRHKDGNVIWVSLSIRRVAGPDGETAYYEGFVEDITARKRIEQKLRSSENTFRMAFMTGADASSITTLENGLILDLNDRFTELFGYSRSEACGRTSEQLGLYADADRERLTAELLSRGHAKDLEFQARRKNGEIRSVLVSANFLPGAGDLILVVVRDISEQKRAEAQNIELEKQFRQAQKLESIGRLAGGVAHDFNNLLTVINGYGDLLLREYKSGDPSREWVEEIRHAGERAANLTRQLLVFSRKQVVERRPMYLHDLIAENQSMLQRLIGEDIELVIESGSSGWAVMADPGQLHQVLMNLAVNARDAMPEGGTLTIRTANILVDEADPAAAPGISPGAYVSLLVSDTGTGIPKDIRDRIFDPFFTTKAPGEGTGLGLATVYGIVRQLGGSIKVSGEEGLGATFEIYLPRLEGEAAASTQAPATGPSAKGSETILVVEDQEPVRKLAVTILKERGYRVLEAADGADALRVAERHSGKIHLLLGDVVMPYMTGKELADRLKPLRPEMKVLYMSGYAADIIARRGLLESGEALIAKPFTPDALAAKVREMLGTLRPTATILVVDDEEPVRGFFQKVLAAAGYEVSTAGDGAEALKILRERRFDLLLTDLVMPEREGLEIIGILHKEWPDLKIVAVSGAFGGRFLKAAELLGAHGALPKPVSPAQLLAAVRDALQ